mgnify:FL=1
MQALQHASLELVVRGQRHIPAFAGDSGTAANRLQVGWFERLKLKLLSLVVAEDLL